MYKRQALDNEAYVHFQMDQKYGIYSLQLPNGITITKQGDWTDTEWTALVAGLPNFDENGHAYEYILLEAGADGEQSFPLSLIHILSGHRPSSFSAAGCR